MMHHWRFSWNCFLTELCYASNCSIACIFFSYSLVCVYVCMIVFVFVCMCLFSLQVGFDVFNALDLMDNKQFIEKLKFGVGDGNLQYYLYNWKCSTMSPNKVRCFQILYQLSTVITLRISNFLRWHTVVFIHYNNNSLLVEFK